MVSIVVSRTGILAVGAVLTAVVGEVRGGGVEVMGGVGAGIDGVVMVVEGGLEGEVVEARVVGDRGEEVKEIEVA